MGLYSKAPQEMEVGWEEGLLEVGCNRVKNKSGETGIKGLGPHQEVESPDSRGGVGGRVPLLQAGCFELRVGLERS